MRRCWPLLVVLTAGCEQTAPGHGFGDTGPSAEDGHLMSGFSWVIDDALAGMPQPGGRAPLELDLSFLSEQGVGLIVSANQEGIDAGAAAAWGIDHVSLPVPDFEAPSQEQMHEFVLLTGGRLDAGERVAVHCTAGLGRTGTYLAVWFVSEGMSADEAIDHVRSLRPGSIETFGQETAIRQFWMGMASP